jgi:hypothetical protein
MPNVADLASRGTADAAAYRYRLRDRPYPRASDPAWSYLPKILRRPRCRESAGLL